jgi:KaiC/GvpD/RAD55 family RecA-like ATPase
LPRTTNPSGWKMKNDTAKKLTMKNTLDSRNAGDMESTTRSLVFAQSLLADSLDGIAKFLELRGHTLLIKGNPGAGKTTLALQLLKHFGEKNTIYVSTRESGEKLENEIPWARTTLRRTAFEDVRLSSASEIIEKVLAAQQRGRHKGKHRNVHAIVLDTWDGLAKEIADERERLKAEKTLISIADGSDLRIIFVSEEPSKTTMDYLVDGIVELSRFEESSRIFREIEMQKLRGTLIEQHKYLYTLAGGIFRHFVPYSSPDYSSAVKFPPLKDTSNGESFSFGSQELDNLFGGIGKGSSFAIEYDENVPYSAIRMIETPAVINALNIGRGVIMIPLPGSSIKHIFSLIKPFVSEEAFLKRFRIGTSRIFQVQNLESQMFSLTPSKIEDSQDSFNTALEEVTKNSADGGVLLVEAISLLENLFATERESMLMRLAERTARVQQESKDALMLLMQEDSSVRSRVLAMSSHYVKLFVRDRSVVVMGEKPSTVAHVIEHSKKNPLLPSLTPIV